MSAARHCTATRVAEIVALAERVRAAALIALPGYGADSDRLDVFAELAGQQALRFCWPVGPADGPPFLALAGPAIDRPASDDANQIMYLPFTSGMTGIPKGVLHSDNTLLATARMMARDWRLEGAVLYTLSPLSHNLGLGALITALAGPNGVGEEFASDSPLEEGGFELMVPPRTEMGGRRHPFWERRRRYTPDRTRNRAESL